MLLGLWFFYDHFDLEAIELFIDKKGKSLKKATYCAEHHFAPFAYIIYWFVKEHFMFLFIILVYSKMCSVCGRLCSEDEERTNTLFNLLVNEPSIFLSKTTLSVMKDEVVHSIRETEGFVICSALLSEMRKRKDGTDVLKVETSEQILTNINNICENTTFIADSVSFIGSTVERIENRLADSASETSEGLEEIKNRLDDIADCLKSGAKEQASIDILDSLRSEVTIMSEDLRNDATKAHIEMTRLAKELKDTCNSALDKSIDCLEETTNAKVNVLECKMSECEEKRLQMEKTLEMLKDISSLVGNANFNTEELVERLKSVKFFYNFLQHDPKTIAVLKNHISPGDVYKNIVHIIKDPKLKRSSNIVKYSRDRLAMDALKIVSPGLYDATILEFRRSLPTIELIYDYLAKFDATLFDVDVTSTAHSFAFSKLRSTYAAVSNSPKYIKSFIHEFENFRDWRNIPVNGNSSPGYPWIFRPEPMMKKNAPGVMLEAQEMALVRFEKGAYFGKWVIYSRAKLRLKQQQDSCRTIEAAPFDLTLVAQKFVTSFDRVMAEMHQELPSGIGSSWFNCGASKLANYFGVTTEKLTETFFLEYDVSTWDTSLTKELLLVARDFRISIIPNFPDGDLRTKVLDLAEGVYHDMINAECIFPDGNVFRLNRGMKSGWAATASDNTLIHTYVFARGIYAVAKKIGTDPSSLLSKIKYKVYGDDNLSLIPIEFKEHFTYGGAFFSALRDLNITVREDKMHISDTLLKTSYLSHKVGLTEHMNLVPYRETREAVARLIFPETFGDEDSTPEETSARIVGHYLDNFYNVEFRTVLEMIYAKIKTDKLSFTPRVLRALSFLDTVGIPTSKLILMQKMPTQREVAQLYGYADDLSGVQIYVGEGRASFSDPLHLCRMIIARPHFSMSHVDHNMDDYLVAIEASSAVGARLKKRLKGVKMYESKWRASPLNVRAMRLKGNAAAKILEIVKQIGLEDRDVNNYLDIGGHPGAMIDCVQSLFPRVSTYAISLIPPQDVKNKELPWPKVDKRRNVKFISRAYKKGDVKVPLIEMFELCVIDAYDITKEDPTAMDAFSVIEPIVDDVVDSDRVRHLVFKILKADKEVIKRLADKFHSYKRWFIIKPVGSYPWNGETYFYVDLMHIEKAKPRSKNECIGHMYWYYNHLAQEIHSATAFREFSAYTGKLNPMKNDFEMQCAFLKKMGINEKDIDEIFRQRIFNSITDRPASFSLSEEEKNGTNVHFVD